MSEFLYLLQNFTFMQNALLAGILVSIGCGITGTFVVVKKISYISGGIAHAVLGGMGLAYYLGFDPLLGATVFALFSAVLLGVISIKVRAYEDTIIGALWAMGMAMGILFISMTPGYTVDLMSFLFGNILMVSRSDLVRMLFLNLLITGVVLYYFQHFVALCFDEEYAHVRGIKVNIMYIVLLCLMALTVVTLIRIVGLILVIALLTLPAAISQLFVRSIAQMIVLSILLGCLFTISGLILSIGPDVPSGPVIILIAGGAFLLALFLKSLLPLKALKTRGKIFK